MRPNPTLQRYTVPIVGIDLVRTSDVEISIAQHGNAYLRRIYTPGELEYAQQGDQREMVQRLAARFAAKEATLKVLSPDGHWFDWRQIEVERAKHGPCAIRLHGGAARHAEYQELGPLSVSLSHEGELAVAVVMGLKNKNARDSN